MNKFIKKFFKGKDSEDERQPEERRQIDLKSLPKVCLPLITPIKKYDNYFYAQINVKSLVVVDPNWAENIRCGKEPKLDIHQGFLFEIKENISIAPEIKMIGIPLIFHPHFRIADTRSSSWIDYKEYDSDEILFDYLLRIARSLNYEKNYIFEKPKIKANPQALEWYLNNSHKFPIDKNLWEERPMENLEVEKQENRHKKAFDIKPKLNSTQLSGKIKKKFKIKKSEPSYNPESRSQPQFKRLREYPSALCRNSIDKHHHIYIKKTAFETIMRHIGWNSVGETSYNIVEQGGILLGKTFIDPDTNITYGVVEQAIAGKSAKGSSAYLEMTHETWKEMLDEADKLLEQPGSEFQIIGWYHTHPNTLDVFMSGTDQATQSRLFGNDWQFAIVLNPQRKIWRAFYGSHSKECKGYIIENEYQNHEHEK
ncbi:MAG: hypothetical protein KAI83_20035 [Thiomargarita sp.]|nr:hypothetical protein [Thiomargarita sp.]